jgi:hypothetical protein
MLMTLPVLMIWMMLNRVLMTRQVMPAAQKFTFPTATDWPFLSKANGTPPLPAKSSVLIIK